MIIHHSPQTFSDSELGTPRDALDPSCQLVSVVKSFRSPSLHGTPTNRCYVAVHPLPSPGLHFSFCGLVFLVQWKRLLPFQVLDTLI